MEVQGLPRPGGVQGQCVPLLGGRGRGEGGPGDNAPWKLKKKYRTDGSCWLLLSSRLLFNFGLFVLISSTDSKNCYNFSPPSLSLSCNY